MNDLILRLTAPGMPVSNTPVYEVILPTTTGKIGIAKDHAFLKSTLDVGVLLSKVTEKDKWTPLVVFGGVFSVSKNEINVFPGRTEEVSKEKADDYKKQFNQATQDLFDANTTKEKLIAVQRLRRANARLEAVGYL